MLARLARALSVPLAEARAAAAERAARPYVERAADEALAAARAAPADGGRPAPAARAGERSSPPLAPQAPLSPRRVTELVELLEDFYRLGFHPGDGLLLTAAACVADAGAPGDAARFQRLRDAFGSAAASAS